MEMNGREVKSEAIWMEVNGREVKGEGKRSEVK
jgi:hypothetical protein